MLENKGKDKKQRREEEEKNTGKLKNYIFTNSQYNLQLQEE
jgi:hypothetical protein